MLSALRQISRLGDLTHLAACPLGDRNPHGGTYLDEAGRQALCALLEARQCGEVPALPGVIQVFWNEHADLPDGCPERGEFTLKLRLPGLGGPDETLELLGIDDHGDHVAAVVAAVQSAQPPSGDDRISGIGQAVWVRLAGREHRFDFPDLGRPGLSELLSLCDTLITLEPVQEAHLQVIDIGTPLFGMPLNVLLLNDVISGRWLSTNRADLTRILGGENGWAGLQEQAGARR